MYVELLLGLTLGSALLVLMAPDRVAGRLAAVLSLLPLGTAAAMWVGYDARGNALLADGGSIAYETEFAWFELGGYTLQWHVGVDGVSFPLVVLTAVLTTLAIVASWTPIDERESQFYGLMLIVETSLLGVFTGLDFFVWFIFWEGVLIPMYLLIAVWGGPRREYAAVKFLVYTNLASLLLFVGIFMLVFALGDSLETLSLVDISQGIQAGNVGSFAGLSPGLVQGVAFVLLFLGFAVKVPVVPFHTWLPDAHVEAPTPVSIMLAGVLLKMGTYALLRFNFTMLEDVVREAPNAPEILTLVGVVSVIYGAVLALAQRDLKRIVAYSSISSMGYVLVGLAAMTPHGVGGATFQMVSHGLISGLLFMAVGVFYNATHTRMIGDMSGLADRMPWTAGVFVAGAFGYMGLPLMSGFAAEVLVFIGAFDSHVAGSTVLTALAMFGIVVVAGYLLWAMQRTLFGSFELETEYELGRAPVHDIASLLALLGLVILLGVNPDFIYGAVQDAVRPLVDPTVDAPAAFVGEFVSLLGGGS